MEKLEVTLGYIEGLLSQFCHWILFSNSHMNILIYIMF